MTQISRFVHKYKWGDIILLYHSLLNMKIALVSNEWQELIHSKFEKPITAVNQLKKYHFLIDDTIEDQQIWKKEYDKSIDITPRAIYLLLNEKCNLSCDYCYALQPFFHKNHKMPFSLASRAINALARESNPKITKEIYYHGGEPLLSFDLIIKCLNLVQSLRKKGELRGDVFQAIPTNGILLNTSICQFLSNHDVYIALSLDGYTLEHNKERFKEKKLLEKVIQNINLLRDHSIQFTIASTLTKYNVDFLEDITEYFVTNFNPSSVQFSLPLIIPGKDYSWFNISEVSNTLIACYEIARKHGVIEGRIGVQVDAFVLERMRLFDCRSNPGEILLTPDGFISPSIETSAFRSFCEKWDENEFNLDKRPNFSYFARTTPLTIDECLDCPAIGICGGGSHYNRLLKYGAIDKMDEDFCVYAKIVHKWLIDQIIKNQSRDKNGEGIPF